MPIADLTVPPIEPAGLGDAEVQRAIDRVGELLIGGDREEHVAAPSPPPCIRGSRGPASSLIWSSALSTSASGQGSPYFSSRSFSRLPALTPMRIAQPLALAALTTSRDALGRADVARVDAQAGGAGVGGLERALVVEMDVGDDRHAARRGRSACSAAVDLDVGAGDADDVGAGLLAAADLVDRRLGVGGRRVGHRLHGDRRVAADGDVADHDLARLAALDRAPGTD